MLDHPSLHKRTNNYINIRYRLIADCTPVEERNKWLARLEAVISAACVLGPAIGSILRRFGYSVPLLFAGVTAGIALLFAAFLLEETEHGGDFMKERILLLEDDTTIAFFTVLLSAYLPARKSAKI